MNVAEFKEWFDYHVTAFTGVEAWFNKQGAARAAAIKSRWADILKLVDLKLARMATDKMFSGEIEEPKGFDRHPAAVRNYAKAVGALAVKEGASDCICGGSGMLDVMADCRWKGKRAFIPGEKFNHRDHLVTVACPCPKGEWINDCRERTTRPGELVFRLEVYDAGTMTLWSVWAKRRRDLELQAIASAAPPKRDVSGIVGDTAQALSNPEANATAQCTPA